MKNKKYSYALLVCAIILAGCAKQQQYEAVEHTLVPDMSMARAMQTAEDVLAKMHFTIEKADPDAGFIRTKPLPGAQFFEFWRKDNVGPGNEALANLHTIRRVVELNFSQQEGGNLRIGCGVQMYRLSLPQDQSTSWAKAPGMFTESSQRRQKLRLRTDLQQAPTWVNMGQDEQLATEILKRIEKRLESQTGHESPTIRNEK